MAQIKNILLRILATFAATGLGVVGAGSIAGVPLWKAICKLSIEEINSVFSKIDKKAPNE